MHVISTVDTLNVHTWDSRAFPFPTIEIHNLTLIDFYIHLLIIFNKLQYIILALSPPHPIPNFFPAKFLRSSHSALPSTATVTASHHRRFSWPWLTVLISEHNSSSIPHFWAQVCRCISESFCPSITEFQSSWRFFERISICY